MIALTTIAIALALGGAAHAVRKLAARLANPAPTVSLQEPAR